MAAAYSFVSRWSAPASTERCWAEIERMLRPGADPSWWPGVTLVEPPARLAAGEDMVIAVRSPLGYLLRVSLAIVGVEEGRSIVAASEGDLRGGGSIEIDHDGPDAASIVFHWDVATEKRWMNATAWMLRPAFERAHARVMRRGEDGLRAALASSS